MEGWLEYLYGSTETKIYYKKQSLPVKQKSSSARFVGVGFSLPVAIQKTSHST
jgi:hypothetical protein